MGQFFSAPGPGPQSEQAHESSSQSGSPSSSAQQPFYQTCSMGHTLSVLPSSPSPTNHPVGAVLPTPSTLPPLYPPSHFRKEIAILSTQARKMLAAKRAERRHLKRIGQLEASFSPVQPATRKQSKRQKMKESLATLRKEACVQHELQRARKAATSPIHFSTIDINMKDDDDDKGLYTSQQSVIGSDSEKGAECNAMKIKAFAGLIVIQDYLSAMRQAISEHTKESALLTEPGRHSFHVDAAVSQQDGCTGIAVVHKTHRQCWDSEWTAMGYMISEPLEITEAETWAIWQALQITLESVRAGRAILRPQEPRSIAVIYSDCQAALRGIENPYPCDKKVVQKIVAQSIELQELGVDVQLHWCPGHRGVPGNVLADLVSKRARRSLT